MDSDFVKAISTLFVIKAKPERERNKLLDAAVLAGASWLMLQYIRSHTEQVEELIAKLYDGSLSPGMFRGQFEKLLADDAINAYAAVKGSKLTSADKAFVKQWVVGQSQHIRSFLDDHLTDKPLESSIIRAPLWGASLAALGSAAFIRTYPTVMGTWKYGDTLKHCLTCSELHDQSQPLSYYLTNGLIPQQPGSETLSCGGWNCKCTVVDSISGKVLLPFHLLEA